MISNPGRFLNTGGVEKEIDLNLHLFLGGGRELKCQTWGWFAETWDQVALERWFFSKDFKFLGEQVYVKKY